MSDLISGVDAKNVKIVDLLSLENLDAASSTRHNQRNERKQSKDVFSVEPEVVIDCLSHCLLAQTEKHKYVKRDEYTEGTQTQSVLKHFLFSHELFFVGFKYFLCFDQISMSELSSIKFDYFVYELFNILGGMIKVFSNLLCSDQ